MLLIVHGVWSRYSSSETALLLKTTDKWGNSGSVKEPSEFLRLGMENCFFLHDDGKEEVQTNLFVLRLHICQAKLCIEVHGIKNCRQLLQVISSNPTWCQHHTDWAAIILLNYGTSYPKTPYKPYHLSWLAAEEETKANPVKDHTNLLPTTHKRVLLCLMKP